MDHLDDLWQESRVMSRYEATVDLVRLAEAGGGTTPPLSLRALSERWQWGVKKTRNFLAFLAQNEILKVVQGHSEGHRYIVDVAGLNGDRGTPMGTTAENDPREGTAKPKETKEVAAPRGTDRKNGQNPTLPRGTGKSLKTQAHTALQGTAGGEPTEGGFRRDSRLFSTPPSGALASSAPTGGGGANGEQQLHGNAARIDRIYRVGEAAGAMRPTARTAHGSWAKMLGRYAEHYSGDLDKAADAICSDVADVAHALRIRGWKYALAVCEGRLEQHCPGQAAQGQLRLGSEVYTSSEGREPTAEERKRFERKRNKGEGGST